MQTSVYHSEESKAIFRARYNAYLSDMPFIQRTVYTPQGETFLLEAGSTNNPAVILLHGSCSNSAFWYNDILALMGNYHVFAADIPGEAGNSAEYRLSLENEDYALWLGAVMDALGLTRASIAGNSLGGWMALKFATANPARVESLMLIASGGLAPINPHFLEQAAAAEEAGEDLVFEEDATGSAAIPQEILDFLNLILASYDPISVPLPVFPGEALARLTMPVLYVAGDNDQLLDTPTGETALRASVPQAQIQILPGVGHMIPTPNIWMLPFLDSNQHTLNSPSSVNH